jgi:phage terminase small subunit
MAKKAVKPVDYSKPLKNRQYEAFCQHHHACKNATQAAKDAGYAVKSAKTKGSQLLTIIDIKGRVDYLACEVAEKCGVTAEKVINELRKLGFSNIKSFLSKDNEIADLSQLPDEITAAVKSVQTTIRHDSGDSEGYTEKVKLDLYDKRASLVDLGRHLGIFEKDNEQHLIIAKEMLTETELKSRLSAIEAAGDGLDLGSIG